MPEPRALPYGSWPSPITIDMAISGELSLREPCFDGDAVYWIEGRPQERGRQVIVRWDEPGSVVDVTPPPYNARSMANEYGGGPYAVDQGTAWFSNLADGRIYRIDPGAQPVPLTEPGPYRYGDLVADRARGRLLCVREDHSGLAALSAAGEGERIAEPSNALVAVDARNGTTAVLAEGNEFFSTPRPSPDGRRLAWLAWDHPNMPWDGTQLWVAEIDDSGHPTAARMVAGGNDESVIQPEWGPDGSLVFISDRSGWSNLYRLDPAGLTSVGSVMATDADFCGPQWVFGMRWYAIAADGTIVAIARRAGRDELWQIPVAGSPRRLDVPDERIEATLRLSGTRLCYVASSSAEPSSIVLFDLDSGQRRVLRRQLELGFDRAFISRSRQIEFETTDGDMAYALYYPPTNADCRGPDGERPPLVVMSHGGPTSSASPALDLEKQVFTSRGFAVVDVDYRGSTGYGRAYRRKLEGKWGIYDVDDCIAAARFLAERGDVDPGRMAIRGGSAGGYTTLCALTFHDVFAAGASHYGVGDLEALARDTHKFESRYIDRLVAPYPERLDVFHERSPIRFVERLSVPLIVLQGADDKVVPVAQAEQIVDALRRQRIPHAYLLFEGEGHGFRQEANIRRAIEAELSFYAQVFGFELADGFVPVAVEYLE